MAVSGADNQLIQNTLISSHMLLGNEQARYTAASNSGDDSMGSIAVNGDSGSVIGDFESIHPQFLATKIANSELTNLEESQYNRLQDREILLIPFADSLIDEIVSISQGGEPTEISSTEYEDKLYALLMYVVEKISNKDLDFAIGLIGQFIEVTKTRCLAQLVFKADNGEIELSGTNIEHLKESLSLKVAKDLKENFSKLLPSIVAHKLGGNLDNLNEDFINSQALKIQETDPSKTIAEIRKDILEGVRLNEELFERVKSKLSEMVSLINSKRDINSITEELRSEYNYAKERCSVIYNELEALDGQLRGLVAQKMQLSLERSELFQEQLQSITNSSEEGVSVESHPIDDDGSIQEITDLISATRAKILQKENEFTKLHDIIKNPQQYLVSYVDANENGLPALEELDCEEITQEFELGASSLVDKVNAIVSLLSVGSIDELGDSNEALIAADLMDGLIISRGHEIIDDSRVESSEYYVSLYTNIISAIESCDQDKYDFYIGLMSSGEYEERGVFDEYFALLQGRGDDDEDIFDYKELDIVFGEDALFVLQAAQCRLNIYRANINAVDFLESGNFFLIESANEEVALDLQDSPTPFGLAHEEILQEFLTEALEQMDGNSPAPAA